MTTAEQLAALDRMVAATTADERRGALADLLELVDRQTPLPPLRQRDEIPPVTGGKFRMGERVYTITAVAADAVTCTDDLSQSHRWSRGGWEIMREAAEPEPELRIR